MRKVQKLKDLKDFNPTVGMPSVLGHGIQRIVAPNPSLMTFRGTNTYLVGTRELVVIDPGPNNLDHLDAILSACRNDQTITKILVTHTHLDHSSLAIKLSEHTNAPILAFGGATAGRSAAMDNLVIAGLVGGEEGIDNEFIPDQVLTDGDIVQVTDLKLEVIHTPGHLGNHVCFATEKLCFTGDHVMGWASSLISPPGGDITDFMASCERLLQRDWAQFYPGHGPIIKAPKNRVNWLINHRKNREAAILKLLDQKPLTLSKITQAVYDDIPTLMLPIAQRNVLAHLIDLMGKSKVEVIGPLCSDTIYKRQ